MSKKVTASIDKKFLQQSDTYVRKIDQLYLAAVKEAAALATTIKGYAPSQPFTWNHYPQTKARIDKIINNLAGNIQVTIDEATKKEWLQANLANDKVAEQFFSSTKLRSIRTGHYYQRNLEALEAFRLRKVGGLDLSQRIWNYAGQFRNELEMCLDIGLSEGISAAELSRDIRKYLQEPHRLYRRIKDKETGRYYLSKNAKKYNPQPGQYRSSYKNAMRLTRTETNMAYRMSDQMRWEQLDFVVGYEIRRSNNKYSCKLCQAMVGRYPKDFQWNGNHPQCRCVRIPILATPDEFLAWQKKKLDGDKTAKLTSENQVTTLPQTFRDWIAENNQRLHNAKSAPYFLKDNSKYISNNLKITI